MCEIETTLVSRVLKDHWLIHCCFRKNETTHLNVSGILTGAPGFFHLTLLLVRQRNTRILLARGSMSDDLTRILRQLSILQSNQASCATLHGVQG
jgi:hypothetical protein